MNSIKMYKLPILILLAGLVGRSLQHGRLYDPPSRSTAWRLNYDVPPNYTDNELNCGGFSNQWNNNDGLCGECGDPYEVPIGDRPNQAGGLYATGTVVGQYVAGQTVEVNLQITAMHWGYWEFRICPVPNKDTPATQDCFDENLLELGTGGTRFNIPNEWGPGEYKVPVIMPEINCHQCVLQWKWYCGNSWGANPDGSECIGCGPQETFWGCADISITGGSGGLTTNEPPPSTESTTTTTTEAPTGPTTTTPTTTTPPEATPSPWPSQVPDVTCTWIGEGSPDEGMDQWCVDNCTHVPSYCHENCICRQNPVKAKK